MYQLVLTLVSTALLLLLTSSSTSASFIGGCGCAASAALPPPCAEFRICPPAPSACPIPTPCTRRRRRAATIADDATKCNSEQLRKIIQENISVDTAEAKLAILKAVESQLNGKFNVICARGDFSYITNTQLYCQDSSGDVSCYVFRHL